jgi:hypothetical protein
LWPGSPGYSADEVFAEAFVAQDLGNLGMAACDIESEWREVHRVGRAQLMVKGIGIGNKLWCPRIEQGSPFGGLNLLVHSLFPMSAIIRMYNVRAARRFCYSVRSAFRDLAKGQ